MLLGNCELPVHFMALVLKASVVPPPEFAQTSNELVSVK
jgi:hypothetical protein